MSVALIITDASPTRQAHLIALELDERLASLGIESQIFDMADRFYNLGLIDTCEAFLLIGSNTGPLYSRETHQLLTDGRYHLRGRKVGTVMVSADPILAEEADQQLRSVLKVIGAQVIPERMVVSNPAGKFDQSLVLKDHSLEVAIDQFLYLFLYGVGAAQEIPVA